MVFADITSSNELGSQVAPWMTIDRAARVMKYALASYGWPLYSLMNMPFGCCLCCSQPKYVLNRHICSGLPLNSNEWSAANYILGRQLHYLVTASSEHIKMGLVVITVQQQATSHLIRIGPRLHWSSYVLGFTRIEPHAQCASRASGLTCIGPHTHWALSALGLARIGPCTH